MLILENIQLAFAGLLANKMRALLTMLGIIIGIASVIAIMTVGDSISNSVTSSMESMGANQITVGLQQKSSEEEVSINGIRFVGGPTRTTMKEEDYITDEMLEELRNTFSEEISGIMLTESVGSGTAEKDTLTANVSVQGINSDYLLGNELTLLSGRTFTERDQEEGRRVALVSDYLVNNLFDGDCNEAVGTTIQVFLNNRYYSYTIIGVYEYDASASFSTESEEDVTTDLYLPLLAAREQNHSKYGYSQMTVLAAENVDSVTFCETLENYFNYGDYRNNENYQVSAFSMESIISSMTEMLSTISIAIAVIAGISLLVGGIGVMNIMLVSITERTREIGTRKAIGADNTSIRIQFIMESVVICLIGGFLGILLGMGLGIGASTYLGYAATPSVGSILFSVSFSIFIGVFFGYYPANKAAKMNPIEALRYE